MFKLEDELSKISGSDLIKNHNSTLNISISLISKFALDSAHKGINDHYQHNLDIEDPHLHEEEKHELFKQIIELSRLRYTEKSNLSNKVSLFYSKASENFGSHTTRLCSILGKLLYLIDHCPKKLFKIFNGNDSLIFEKLEDLFSSEAKLIKIQIHKKKEELFNGFLQNTDQVIENLLPLTLSEMLWTSTGHLNTPIIHKLHKRFFPIEEVSKLHQKQIVYVLKELLNNKSLVHELEDLHRDSDKPLQIDHAVRARLNLSMNEPVTSLHLKKSALAALFSHPRQERAGSCFAAFLPISLLTSNLNRVFKDLRSLLTKNCIETTSSNRVTMQIPYTMIISSNEIDKKVVINAKGRLFDHEKCLGSLEHYPAWIAVCHSLDIGDPSEGLQKALKKLGHFGVKEKKEVMVKDLILALCESIDSDKTVQELFDLAKFYYKSVSHPPLLTCWINAIANLCETQTNSYLKTAIMQTFLPSLLEKFDSKINATTLQNNKAFHFVTNTLSSLFIKSTHLIYDPSAHGSEGNMEGGFVLEFRSNKKWIRVEDEKKFLDLAILLLRELKIKLDSTSLPTEIKLDLEQGIKAISEKLGVGWAIKTKNRFKKHLQKQHGDEPSIKASSPWSILTGHDAGRILELYLGQPPSKVEIIPLTAENALKKILSISSSKNALETSPSQGPLRIRGFHACTWMTDHLTKYNIPKDEKGLDSWIYENIKKEGERLSSFPISMEMKIYLLNFCEQFILESEKKIWSQQIDNLKIDTLKEEMTIYDFRNMLIKIIHPSVAKSKIKKIECKIDSTLIKILPENLQKEWLSTILPFADTNWHSGCKDIYFCFAYNIGKKNIEIWQMKEDKTKIQPLDTDKMLNKTWEIYDPLR